jgi:DNA-binding transcriptional regulator LsrR (DeoR family)
MRTETKVNDAVRAARMYYYQNLTTAVIAKEMKVSRSTVSRLLSFARDSGLIDIRVVEPSEHPDKLSKSISDYFGISNVHVVPVPEIAGEAEWLERVAQYTANYLNTLFESNMTLGIAWGTTLTAISRHLLRKTTYNSQIVQLNGAGNTRSMGIGYASQIIMRFSENYRARAHLFPVPTFFDFSETKQALWKEGSIKRILDLQRKADLLLYSIGAVNAGIPSHVYSGGYLSQEDYKHLETQKVAGDIATVFFREDGTWHDIPINQRCSGPNLDLFQRVRGICVVSGLAKIHGLHAALTGKMMSELIVDEPTARVYVNQYLASSN